MKYIFLVAGILCLLTLALANSCRARWYYCAKCTYYWSNQGEFSKIGPGSGNCKFKHCPKCETPV